MAFPILFPPASSPNQNSFLTTGPFDITPPGSTQTLNPTEATVPIFGAFKRLWVSYLYKGIATIAWELNPNFQDPGPYTFQLQYSQSGTDRGDDWINVGSTTNGFSTTDDHSNGNQRMYGKTPTLIYRVLLTTPLGVYVSQLVNILGLLNKYDWLLVRELLRKEQLNHRIFSSVKGYLLKARRYGPKCTDSLDPDEGEIINSNCPTCYGTGFLAGYYPATEYYALLDLENARENRDPERGTAKDVIISARFLATLPLVQGDAWINIGSDERYYVHRVKEEAAWKSVPVVYTVELRLAPFTDILYDVPLI